MPISVDCTQCGGRFKVKDDKAGERVRCRECGSMVRVPDDDIFGGGGGGGDDEDVLPSPRRPRSGGKRPSSKSNGGNSALLLILLGGGGALAALLVFAVLVARAVMMGGGNAPEVVNNPPGFVPPPGAAPAPFVPPGGFAPPPGAVPAGGGAAPAPFVPATGFTPTEGGAPALVANWEAKSDPEPTPAEEAPVADPKKKLVIPVPGGRGDVVFPLSNANFVAVGENNQPKDIREVWNLRTGKKVGSLKGLSFYASTTALSPDGLYFAGLLSGKQVPTIGVWNMKEGKPLGELAVAPKIGHLELLAFAGPDRLLTKIHQEPMRVWTIPDGKQDREITFDGVISLDPIAISPGGKYLANFNDERVKLTDLTTGKPAGEVQLPAPDRFGRWHPAGLVFSPDGTELAGLFTAGSTGALFALSMDNGEVVAKHLFEEDLRQAIPGAFTYRGRPLEWFPDKTKWLVYGLGIIDREVGGPIWVAPTQENSIPERRLLGNDRILVMDSSSRNSALMAADIPLDQIQAASKVVKQGGRAMDAGLPPITKADESQVRILSARAGGGWTMQADPAPATSKKIAANITVKGDAAHMRGMLMSGPQACDVLLWYGSGDRSLAARFFPAIGRQNQAPPPAEAKGNPVWFTRYDLEKGKEVNTFTVAVDSDLMNYSPAGTLIVCRVAPILSKEEERIDIWSTADGAHVAGFRPYETEKEEGDRKPTAAAFLDDTHLATVNQRGSLVLWQLPECKALYRVEDAQKPGVSPGGKYLSLSTGKGVQFLTAANGDSAGTIGLEGSYGAAAFHQDGTRCATLSFTGAGDNICEVWDLATGKSTTKFYLPAGGTHLEWCGDNFLLADNSILIDIKQEAILWRYSLPAGAHVPNGLDGRHWFIAGARGGRDANALSLTGVTLPEPQALERISKSNFKELPVVGPGAQVAVKLASLPAVATQPNLIKDVTAHIREELNGNGMTAKDGAPMAVSVSMVHSNTGKTEEYSFFGRGSASVAQTKVDCTVAFEVNGQAVWTRVVPFMNTTYFVSVPEGKDLTAHLAENQWNAASEYLKSVELPTHIFTDKAGQGIGTSTFVAGGVGTN